MTTKIEAVKAGSKAAAESAAPRSLVSKVFLGCGILSSLFYAAMDVIGGTRWESYSWISQEFSRLSAIGAPSRPLHLLLSPIYTLLVIAFGLGVWRAARQRRALRVVAGLLVVYAVVSVIWAQFFPENLSEPVGALTNTMHIILTGVTVLSILLQIGFGGAALGKGFRVYSILTFLAVMIFGILAGSQASAMIAGQPTPWLGLTERVNIYGYMLWVLTLAVVLLKGENSAASNQK